MTSNPMTQETVYNTYAGVAEEPMTVAGAANKALILLSVVVFSAFYTWYIALKGFMDKTMLFIIGGSIAGLVLAIIMRFKPQQAKLLSVAYAVCEGLALGGISALYEARFHGLVINAVGLTFAAMFSMLFLYKVGAIKATEKFRAVIMTATMGILVFYLISLVGSFFNANFMAAAFSAGILGIGISLAIVVIASLNFILDFDFIEKGAASMMPKYFEWYGAFALLVTLVWLYLEMLRLLSLLSRRD